jgi:hypothetical protein
MAMMNRESLHLLEQSGVKFLPTLLQANDGEDVITPPLKDR